MPPVFALSMPEHTMEMYGVLRPKFKPTLISAYTCVRLRPGQGRPDYDLDGQAGPVTNQSPIIRHQSPVGESPATDVRRCGAVLAATHSRRTDRRCDVTGAAVRGAADTSSGGGHSRGTSGVCRHPTRPTRPCRPSDCLTGPPPTPTSSLC